VSGTVARIGVGTRLVWDGEAAEVVELLDRHVLVRDARQRLVRVSLVSLLDDRSGRARLVGAEQPAGQEPAGRGAPAVAELLGELRDDERAVVAERAGHVREVMSGYRAGAPELAGAGEPRAGYEPGTTLTARYQAKAAELGVSVMTVRRWVKGYQASGEAGLVDGRTRARAGRLDGVDGRWLETCRVVLAEQVESSTPNKATILRRVRARLEREHGPGQVPLPGRTKAYQVLGELSRGRSMWSNSKARRSIANRPSGTYGRLEATRPGEYLLLDTNSLDVYAMEAATLRWVQVELTVALDLYSRCVAGLRLTPVSTKSIDVASVVYEALRPRPLPAGCAEGAWPYHGVPAAVVVPADALDPASAMCAGAVPPLAPETLVVDHGKIYVSAHLSSACARLGISIQPARPYTPTDKAAIERFFRSLREDLLAVLPGYKGPDVFNRGQGVEHEAFFFLHELEDIIREWVAVIYHRRPHEGLLDAHVPGLKLCPAAMFEHGVARSGYLQVPADPDLVYELLPVRWTSIQHYGVEVGTLRYNGDGLNAYRNTRSPYQGRHAGKWPIRYNPDDASRVWFHDPDTGRWHALAWEHAARVRLPFSFEALAYARRLAAQADRFPDTERTLGELLDRWGVGLAGTPTERRMALRLAQQRAAIQPAAAEEVAGLASVRTVLDATTADRADAGEPAGAPTATLAEDADPMAASGPLGGGSGELGDDDADEDLDADPDSDQGDYYADAVEPLL
jgi:transposase InsO family protein